MVIVILLFYYKRRRDKISAYEQSNGYYDSDGKRKVPNNNDIFIELNEINKEETVEEDDNIRPGLRGKSVKQLFNNFKARVDDESKGTDYSSDDNENISSIKTKQQQQQQLQKQKQSWRGNKNYEKIDLMNIKDEGVRVWLNKSIVVPLNSTDDDAFDQI
jgi:hypothetical protein